MPSPRAPSRGPREHAMLGELNARRCIHPPSIHASWHAVSSAASSSPHRAVDLARSITPSRRAPSPAPVDDVRAISLPVASRSTASRNVTVWCATPRSLSLPPPSAAEQPGTARSSSLLQRTRLICRRYRSLDARTSVSCTATTAVVSATPQVRTTMFVRDARVLPRTRATGQSYATRRGLARESRIQRHQHSMHP